MIDTKTYEALATIYSQLMILDKNLDDIIVMIKALQQTAIEDETRK